MLCAGLGQHRPTKWPSRHQCMCECGLWIGCSRYTAVSARYGTRANKCRHAQRVLFLCSFNRAPANRLQTEQFCFSTSVLCVAILSFESLVFHNFVECDLITIDCLIGTETNIDWEFSLHFGRTQTNTNSIGNFIACVRSVWPWRVIVWCLGIRHWSDWNYILCDKLFIFSSVFLSFFFSNLTHMRLRNALNWKWENDLELLCKMPRMSRKNCRRLVEGLVQQLNDVQFLLLWITRLICFVASIAIAYGLTHESVCIFIPIHESRMCAKCKRIRIRIFCFSIWIESYFRWICARFDWNVLLEKSACVAQSAGSFPRMHLQCYNQVKAHIRRKAWRPWADQQVLRRYTAIRMTAAIVIKAQLWMH